MFRHPPQRRETVTTIAVVALAGVGLPLALGRTGEAIERFPQPKDYHKEGDVWEHTLQCARNFLPEHGPDVRLAALFHDCGKAQTFSLEERIRFDHHASVSADLASAALRRLQCPTKRRRHR
jgi:putative nucleotidyltransferase with HDIG domain